VWVSEVMLQQTRAEVVAERFEPFLAKFPDPSAMAAAGEDAVVAAWSGLGYYRRARALHAGAASVVREHGGSVPLAVEALRALPGVGFYTAAAIASIAGGRVAAAIDGNVERVLARLLAIEEDPKKGDARRCLEAAAAALIDLGRPGDWNEAMMDLGALVCTPRSPECASCPWAGSCRARAKGTVANIPHRRPRPPVRRLVLAAAVIEGPSGVLLLQRPADAGWMPSMWELPAVEVGRDCDGEGIRAALEGLVARRSALRLRLRETGAQVRHSIVDRRLEVSLLRARTRSRAAAGPGWCFADPAGRGELALSSLVGKCLAAL
jgi:A/G-specific adenine glycosylase